MRTMTRTIVGFAAIAGAMVLTAASTPALASETAGAMVAKRAAADPPPGVPCSTDGWAHTCYEPLGDIIWVKDAKEDGHHADSRFWGSGWPDVTTCHNRLGAAAGWTYCDQFSELIPENELITLWPMESDSGEYMIPESGGTQISSSTT